MTFQGNLFMNDSSKNLPKLVLIVVALLVVLAGIKYLPDYVTSNQTVLDNSNSIDTTTEPTQDNTQADAQQEDQQIVESVFYEAHEDGVTAFDLLQENAKVEYKEYDFGVFVESINGVPGNTEYFWALYVNDEKANAGADITILNTGDTVEWKYEKITN